MNEELLLLQFRDLELTKNELIRSLQASSFFRPFIYNKDGIKSEIYESVKDDLYHISITVENITKVLSAFQDKRIGVREMVDWCDFVRFSNVFCYPEEYDEQELVANLIDEIQNSEHYTEEIMSTKVEKWLSE